MDSKSLMPEGLFIGRTLDINAVDVFYYGYYLSENIFILWLVESRPIYL